MFYIFFFQRCRFYTVVTFQVHPMVLVPRTNGWIRGGRLQPELVDSGIKPVTEPLPDDLKYDFRTKTHTLR